MKRVVLRLMRAADELARRAPAPSEVSKALVRRAMVDCNFADLHTKARFETHPEYPARMHVPNERVDWSVAWNDYAPAEFTAPILYEHDFTKKAGGWADPPDPRALGQEEWARRISHEGPLTFFPSGRPRNPKGRTGMAGRGLIAKWGANQVADPIVTRLDPTRPSVLQMVAIQRKDRTGQWSIPGGFVFEGETAADAAKRCIMRCMPTSPPQEAAIVTHTSGRYRRASFSGLGSSDHRARYDALVDELFATGEIVYRGYVDDPRTTDHAWLESTALHFHCGAEVATLLKLENQDARSTGVMWLDVNAQDPRFENLYASHREWVEIVKDLYIESSPLRTCEPLNSPGSSTGSRSWRIST